MHVCFNVLAQTDIMVNWRMLSRSADYPLINCILHLRHYASYSEFIQCNGRGLRRAQLSRLPTAVRNMEKKHFPGGLDRDKQKLAILELALNGHVPYYER